MTWRQPMLPVLLLTLAAGPLAESPPVGQLILLGHEQTNQRVSLRQLPLYPGAKLLYASLRQAERNLARLRLFAGTPTFTVKDDPFTPRSIYKTVIIEVDELPPTPAWNLRHGLLLGVEQFRDL